MSYLCYVNPIELNSELEKDFLHNFQTNQNIAHKICRAYTDNEDAHKDLFQEITIQLWKAYPKFRGEAKFSTWMYRIALNTAITLYRKKKFPAVILRLYQAYGPNQTKNRLIPIIITKSLKNLKSSVLTSSIDLISLKAFSLQYIQLCKSAG